MATKYRRKFKDRIEDRDPNVMWMEFGDGHVTRENGRYTCFERGLRITRDAGILFQTHMLHFGQTVERGQIVSATTSAWSALREEVLKDPSLMDCFPVWHRKFEEFVAGGYLMAHWSDVILSPRSRDGGFDVAAYKRGRQIMDEAKAYDSNSPVDQTIVRAALGLLVMNSDVHQVRVTTTSSFAPTIPQEFRKMIPGRLVLRDWGQLLRWLRSIGNRCQR